MKGVSFIKQMKITQLLPHKKDLTDILLNTFTMMNQSHQYSLLQGIKDKFTHMVSLTMKM
jgi:hypothetical protein